MSVVRTNVLSAKGGQGTIVIPTGNRLYAPGHVVQMVTVSSGPVSQTISSLTPVAVDGLSINFTPVFANSRILVQAQIATNMVHVSSFGVFKDGEPTVSTTGFTNGNEANMQVTTYIGSTTNAEMWCLPIMWSDLAGSTNTRTYQIYATAGFAGTLYTLVINNRVGSDMSSFSNMTIMEIAQ